MSQCNLKLMLECAEGSGGTGLELGCMSSRKSERAIHGLARNWAELERSTGDVLAFLGHSVRARAAYWSNSTQLYMMPIDINSCSATISYCRMW